MLVGFIQRGSHIASATFDNINGSGGGRVRRRFSNVRLTWTRETQNHAVCNPTKINLVQDILTVGSAEPRLIHPAPPHVMNRTSRAIPRTCATAED